VGNDKLNTPVDQERPRKTEIGTELDHVTCDSDTTFQVRVSE